MIRNFRYLGLALVVALAMSSVFVSMASGDVLTSEKAGTTTLAGKQGAVADVFKVHGGEVKCTSVTYAGTFTTGGASVTVTPAYSGCTFAGLAATVDVNICWFVLTLNITNNTEHAIDLECLPGTEITVTAPSAGTKKCIIHIPPQEDITQVTGTNIGSGSTREVTLDINVTNLKYSQTAGTAETGNCATADNTTGGTYTGDATVTGSAGGVHVGIFLS